MSVVSVVCGLVILVLLVLYFLYYIPLRLVVIVLCTWCVHAFVSTELCTVETVTVLLRYHNILMIPLTLN